jgi:hypothetical protein
MSSQQLLMDAALPQQPSQVNLRATRDRRLRNWHSKIQKFKSQLPYWLLAKLWGPLSDASGQVSQNELPTAAYGPSPPPTTKPGQPKGNSGSGMSKLALENSKLKSQLPYWLPPARSLGALAGDDLPSPPPPPSHTRLDRRRPWADDTPAVGGISQLPLWGLRAY